MRTEHLLTQNRLATRANVRWEKILKLVVDGRLKPAARVNGNQLLFAEDDVKTVQRFLRSSVPAEVQVSL